MERNKKVFLLGIDGFDFKILLPLIKKGFLPNFEKILKKGLAKPLRSTIPFHSAPAWTSMTTGVKPEKHGVFHFHKLIEDKEQIVTSLDKKYPSLWNILSKRGLKSIILNVPVTFPPDEINGIMVSGGILAPRNGNTIYPEELKEEIVQGNYLTYPKNIAHATTQFRPNLLIRELSRVSQKRMELALKLMKDYQWHFFMLVLRSFDFLIHKIYPLFLDPSHPFYEKFGAKRYSKVFVEYCITLDKLLEKLLKRIDKETSLLIASDHGFNPIHRFFSPLPILEELNLLKFKQNKKKRQNSNFKSCSRDNFYQFLAKLNLLSLFRKTLYRIEEKIRIIQKKQRQSYLTGIDLPASKVIPYGRQMLLVKAKNEQEAKKIINRVKNRFLQIKDPKTGKHPIKGFDIIPDPVTEKKGAYILLVKKREEYAFYNRGRSKVFTNSLSGRHGSFGIFLGWNKQFKNVRPRKKTYNIWDVTPTVLSLLNVEKPKWMDGRSILEK